MKFNRLPVKWSAQEMRALFPEGAAASDRTGESCVVSRVSREPWGWSSGRRAASSESPGSQAHRVASVDTTPDSFFLDGHDAQLASLFPLAWSFARKAKTLPSVKPRLELDSEVPTDALTWTR